jgi:hypothetical protein
LNAIQGYGISILCFLFGAISLPSKMDLPIQSLRISHIQPAVDEGDMVVLAPLSALSEGPQESQDAEQELTNESEELVSGGVSPLRVGADVAERMTSVSLPKVRNDHPGRRKAVPSDKSQRCPELEDTLRAYGMYPIQTWSYIAWRESRCRPDAQNATWDSKGNMTYALNKNGSYDTGLLQINSSWRTVTATVCGEKALRNRMQGLKDIDCNIRVARYIMENSSGGLSNWGM